MAKLTDGQFINWIADRIVNVYGESEDEDFVQRLRKLGGPENREHLESVDCWCNPRVEHIPPASRGVFP